MRGDIPAEGVQIDVTGLLLPCRGKKPVLLALRKSARPDGILYMPSFTNEERLDAFMAHVGIRWNNVRKVHDGALFLQSMESAFDVLLIVDPYIAEDQSMRYLYGVQGFEQ